MKILAYHLPLDAKTKNTANAKLSGKILLAKMREVRAAANCNFSV